MSRKESDPEFSRRAVLWMPPAATLAGAAAAGSAQAQLGGEATSGPLFANLARGSVAVAANLVKTSGFGAVGEGAAEYVYDPAVDAAHVRANARTSFLEGGGRGFRLNPQQRLTIQMFGGRADGASDPGYGHTRGARGATDNAAALQSALTFLQASKVAVGAELYQRGGARIHFPAADGVYDFHSTVEVRSSCWITGDSHGHFGGSHSSILRWRPGMHGLIVHSSNTAASGTVSPRAYGGGGTVLEGLGIFQHEAGNNLEAEDFHGVWMRGRATIRNFAIAGFSGNGLNIVGSMNAGGRDEGNVNSFRVENGMVYGCENGIFVDGGDANAGHVIGVDASANRGWGFWDSSFLGNTYLACHASDNGTITRSTRGSIVSHEGSLYWVVPGQLAAAQRSRPGSNAEAWLQLGAGGPSAMAPSWTSGIAVREGGGYRFDSNAARNVVLGCYSEAGQGANHAVAPTMIFGGDYYYGWSGSAVFLHSDAGYFSSSQPMEWRPGGANKFIARLGSMADGVASVLHLEDPVRIGPVGTAYVRLAWGGVSPQGSWKDLVFTTGNPALSRWAFRITMPLTEETFGRNAAQPLVFTANEIAIGRRIHQSGSAAPRAGYHAAGEICWNDHSDAANSAVDYWICKTAGSPGRWVARP